MNVDTIMGWVSLYAFNVIGALLIFIVGKWLASKIADLLQQDERQFARREREIGAL